MPVRFRWRPASFPAYRPTFIWSSRPWRTPFELHADNSPGYDTQEARLSLFVKGSYTATKDTLVRALLGADFCITDRRYIAHEDDTGFHHYAIDVAKLYQL